MDDDETQRRNCERLSQVGKCRLTRDGYDELKWHITTIFGPPDPVFSDPPLFYLPYLIPIQQQRTRKWRAVMEIMESIWRENRGRGSGARFPVDGMDGPLIRLMAELFHIHGVKDPPSLRTLRRALGEVRRGRLWWR